VKQNLRSYQLLQYTSTGSVPVRALDGGIGKIKALGSEKDK
jgi:hypothetical protein